MGNQIVANSTHISLTDFSFRGVQNMVNCVVLLLSDPCNHAMYRCLCGCCHLMCQRMFVWCIARKLPPDGAGTAALSESPLLDEDTVQNDLLAQGPQRRGTSVHVHSVNSCVTSFE